MPKIVEISSEIFTEIGEPTDISPTFISLWLAENLGKLNIVINQEYAINPDNSEYTPELGEPEKSILKQMFLVFYYGKKLAAVLNSADSNSVVEVSEAGGTIRFLNKNELAKTYQSLKQSEENNLKDLIYTYRLNNSAPSVIQGKDGLDTLPYSPDSIFNRSQ